MRQMYRWGNILCLLVVALLVDFLPAAEAPFIGTWRVAATFLPAGLDVTFALVRIQDHAGQLDGELISVRPNFQGATVRNARFDKQGLRFQIQTGSQTIPIYVLVSPARGSAKELLGSVWLRDQAEPLRLECTDSKKLDPNVTRKPAEGADAFQKAACNSDAQRREAALREVVQEYAGKPIAYAAAQELLQAKAQGGSGASELKSAATRYFEAAASFGPDLEFCAAIEAARLLSNQKDGFALAQNYALRAARMLRSVDAPVQAMGLLQTLARALRKCGREDEGKAVDERIARLEQILDDESALPPEPSQAADRKASSNRVVLVELFTSAHCAYCPAAVRACDALLKTYEPNRMVLLENHVVGPLVSPDGRAWWETYGTRVSGTPEVLIDGKNGPLGDGPGGNYDALRGRVEKALEVHAGARLKLSARAQGSEWEVLAEVGGLKQPSGKAFLHFALIEEEVRFPGLNGLRLHRHVVRSFLGGVQGFALKGESARQVVTVDRAAVTRSLQKYLDGAIQWAGKPPESGWPLKLKHLKVIAFLQDATSKEILQAAQVDLPEPR